MQRRHIDRQRYFTELSETCRRYIVPYIQQHTPIGPGISVLEPGCGEGGNLLPFATAGCRDTGIDISTKRILQARQYSSNYNCNIQFIDSDMFRYDFKGATFDIIICHDVFEHIQPKDLFLAFLKSHLKPNGVVFLAFPAWQMPFGGHQQICHNKFISLCPFIHLLPESLYKYILKSFGETDKRISELLDIKTQRTTIEQAQYEIEQSGFEIADEIFWFINPHYEQKFGLKPRKLNRIIGKTPHLRNYFRTSYWCVLKFK